MILAAAQTNPYLKSIAQNIENHVKFVEKAVENGVQIITFPEMSLTGYEREQAKNLAFEPLDERLYRLKVLSVKHKMVIVAGAPILLNNALYIGSFILFPDGSEKIYTKQYLHDGEEIAFCASFDYNPNVEISNEQVSLAICADITHHEHPAKACDTNSTVYLPSIFFTPNGMSDAYSRLKTYANEYKMAILMSNYCGKSYGYDAGGKSAFWNSKGDLIGYLNETDEGLLIVNKRYEAWSAKIITM